nr:beta-N-acetylhexosaminidase [Armatimonadota bacterium]
MFGVLFAVAFVNHADPAVFPRPQEMRYVNGPAAFVLDEKTAVVDPSGQFYFLDDMLKRAAMLDLRTVKKPPGHNFIRFSNGPLPAGGYTLKVTDKSVSVTYGDRAGAFYAVQTLRQLLPPQIESARRIPANWEIPAVEIKDWPRFPWRGMHLDVSRHFFKVGYIKKFIDYLAMHKMNTFHWHLVDDGGWRQESKRFPKLTEVGAWRADTGEIWPGGAWNMGDLEFPGKGTGKKLYGGFYTQKDIRDIVKYAKERHVTVVPEIEMPGHALPALVAYPKLGCQNTAAAGLPRTNVFCVGNDKTLAFLEDILDETIGLFTSKFIHIGADEVWKGFWKNCPRCQARIKAEGLKDEDELQSWFVRRMERHLWKRRRRLIGWDEILEGGLAPGAAVMSWRGIDGGIAAARAGHDVVMSPTSHCYFDYSYATTSTEKAYSYEPVPAELNASEAKHVLGAQANVWTEYIATNQRVDEMIFPRMLGIAEGVWTMRKRRHVDDFKRRLDAYYEWLDIMGTAYY